MASRFRTRIVYWLFALFLVAVAAVTGLWFVGASLVREQIADVGSALAGEGGTYSAETLTITGFPFYFDAQLGGVVVSGRDSARGAWEWRADRAILHLSPWRTRDVTFDLAGTHKLRFQLGRMPLNLEIETPAAPGAVIAGGDGTPHIVRLAPQRMVAREVTTGSVLNAVAANLQLFLYPERKADPTEPAAGLLLELAGVDLPEHLGKYLGSRLTKLGAEVQVLSGLPVPVNRQTLARWREQGGTVEIKSLSAEWGPVLMEGSGTVTLDSALQPEASFAARMTGFEQAADALVAAGIIREQDAQSVKLLLSLMARRSHPGQPAEIRVPITIQERTVYVGPARLARLPVIRW